MSRESEMLVLLWGILGQRAPSLSKAIDSAVVGAVRAMDRDQLEDLVSDEFVAHGLGDGDEPTEYGRRVENLLDWALRDFRS
jgi:hypothetical protein